jgi:shikimate kinase
VWLRYHKGLPVDDFHLDVVTILSANVSYDGLVSATLTRDDSLSSKLESAINSENEDEDILTEEKESKGQQWFFCQPTSTSTSLFWKHFDTFDTTKHPDKKDKAACKYCFAISRFK